jgi:4-hydroxy-3-polyprenylbenzoate decarboxylase
MKTLQDFIEYLEKNNELIRIKEPISTYLELTEIQSRLIKVGGPAVLCENVYGKDGEKYKYPVLINLFTTKNRFNLGLRKTAQEVEELAEMLAFLRQPRPPKNIKDAFNYLPILKTVMNMGSNVVKKAKCQEVVYEGVAVDLDSLPIQWCFPGEPAPLITWGVTITHGPSYGKKEVEDVDDFNLGIYRMQKLSNNKLIMRWLAHRGGAQHFARWKKQNPGQDMPVSVAIGMDPALILAAVMPVPDNLSEYKFAGLLRGEKTELVKSITSDILVPANAEIILEGVIKHNETAKEGPYGDHTGYYNEVEEFPVFEVTAITTRKNPVYLSTYTSRPNDEPSILAECLNDMFVPLIKQQFPEIVDFYLVPDACSYRMINVSIKKAYAGHSKRIMMGIWSYLRQFMYTKLIVVVDEDIDVRNMKDIVWAISTNVDFARDCTIIENTPIDYLDFASPVSGLGSKMGIDATTKIYPETTRQWGRKIEMSEQTIADIDDKWFKLGLGEFVQSIWKK